MARSKNRGTSRRVRAIGIGAAAATAALVVTGVVAANGAGAAQLTPAPTTPAPTAPSPSAPSPSAPTIPTPTATAPAAAHSQLLELQTPDSAGYFYTADQAEYLRVQKLGFKPSGQTPGYVSAEAVSGTVPLYRLQSLAKASFLLTASAAERDTLVASGKFKNDGVVGNVPAGKGDDRVLIYRVSKDGQWRAVPAGAVDDQVKAGWHVDGPLAYFWTSK